MELLGLLCLAIVAGVVSFSSPCVLPLLPGYVSYVSRLEDRRTDATPRRPDLGAALFVAGFAAVFVAMGLTASAVGFLLRQHLDAVSRIGGVLVVVLGLAMTGLLRIPFLDREFRPGLRRFGGGPGSSLGLGAAFAFGWTPCVGPVLATILTIAASSGELGAGVLLLSGYALGLGIPFLLLARAVRRGRERLGWLRRNSRPIEIAGGLVLAATGVLMISGAWTSLMAGALAGYARLGWPPI